MSSVQSIERAFAVLRCLAAGPAGVSNLAEQSDLPKSTVSRLLATLQDLDAVEQLSPGGDYRLGALVHHIAGAAVPGRTLERLARPHLTELTAQTGEETGLSVLEGTDVLYLEQVDSGNPVMVRDWTGAKVPAHVVSAGLVLLAFAPEKLIETHLEGPLVSFTEKSMTDPDALRTRLARVREAGHAWVREEFQVGINSVAAPIRSADGAVVAAIHAHGPSYRFPARRTSRAVASKVMATAERISEQFGSVESLAG